MDDSSRKTITKNLIRIKEVLCHDLDLYVDELIQKDIFDMDIKDKLDGSQMPKDKSDIFIRMVVHKGPKACDEFVKLLHEKKYELMTTEKVESKGSGGKEESLLYIRELSFLVRNHMWFLMFRTLAMVPDR